MPAKLKLKWRPILKKCRLADVPLELILELAGLLRSSRGKMVGHENGDTTPDERLVGEERAIALNGELRAR